MTLEELRKDPDWQEVFGEPGCSGSGTGKADSADGTPAEPNPTLASVTEILAVRNGLNDGQSWVGAFRLEDGRYLYATGWCDYSGWG